MKTNCKILLLSDFLRELLRPVPSGYSGNTKKRILLVRADRIGDFALFAPFLRAVRREFPGDHYHLTLLGNRLWMPLAETIADFDDYIPVSPEDFIHDHSHRRKVLNHVRQGNYDTVWQWRYFREPWVEGMISLAAGKKAGHLAFNLTEKHPGHHFCRLADAVLKTEYLVTAADTHEILKNLIFWKKISGKDDLPPPTASTVPKPDALPGLDPGSYTVILPGTAKAPECRWSVEKFQQLLQLLPEQNRFVITGTPEEKKLLEQAAGNRQNCRIICSTDIKSFAAIIANSGAVIGNDTGGIHLAALYGVPSIAVAGAGQAGWFLPYPSRSEYPVMAAYPSPPETISGNCPDAGCNWHCHLPQTGDGSVPCIGNIPVESIAERAVSILANRIL